ncbi:MAG TPA: hypothetical protein VFO95_08145, partial [Gemmatimonadales bacterium]|nr:hypothetical protein [Gemmatimonadales bacterium]
YALGCVAYWLLSARPVFRAPSAVGLLLKHASEAPPRLTSPVASIPVALEAIVMRCLEKDPAHRPADARAIERSLEQLGIGQLWSDMEATEWWNVHRPATAPVPVRATPV